MLPSLNIEQLCIVNVYMWTVAPPLFSKSKASFADQDGCRAQYGL